MLITCPECKTTYNAPSIADNPEKKVRCAKCGRVWTPGAEAIDMSLLDFSLEKELEKEREKFPDFSANAFQNRFVSEEKKEIDYLKWLKPLYFFSLFCIAVSIFLFFFHLPKRADVTLQPVSYEMVQENYKQYLLLKTAAYNNTDDEIRPLTFTVRFKDENNNDLTVLTLDSPIEVLPPRDITKIDFKIERPPSQTASVTLTLTETDNP